MQPVNSRRSMLRDAYNGELSVNLPDMQRAEPAMVANIIKSGINGLAVRVSSTLPSIYCPARDEFVKREVTAADKRRRAFYGWWQQNRMDLLMGIRAKHMLGYGAAPIQVWPDFVNNRPQWKLRNPMATFPAACTNPSDMTPTDCIFAYELTYDQVKRQWPDQFERLFRKEKPSRDSKLTMLDYTDADELVTLVLGDGPPQDSWTVAQSYKMPGFAGSARHVVLEQVKNRAGVCLAVTPGPLTMDKMLGQFDGVLGMYQYMSRLTALELIAVEKGIFPDTFLESRPGEIADFVSGPFDGRTGKINIVKGGAIRDLGTNPGYQTNPAIDRIERAVRLTAGVPAELGGEAASNIRTGRRGETLLAAAVDFSLAEQQKVFAVSMEEENIRAAYVAKGWFGTRPMSFFVQWKGAKGQVDFVPNEIFTTAANIVSHSASGSDANGLAIQIGQKVGMGIMSLQTAAELDPLIQDPEMERDRTTVEALDAALRAAVQQKANTGEIALIDLAWLKQQVKTNKMELDEALMKVDERVKKRQEAAMEQQADPAMANPLAGLATGSPAEAQVVPPTIAPANESQQNLAGLLGKLRQPQMVLDSERPAV